MPAPGVAPRLAAARVLDAVVRRGRSLKAELARVLPALDDPRDRALVEAICFAALRQRHRYEAALRGWVPRPLGARDGELQGLLLAGLAQIDALALPAHAALSATVDAARALHRERQAGMVNALLRRAQREGVPAADPAGAWPHWLRDQVAADWPEQAAGIFAASAQPAPLWLRVNRRCGTREAYLARLAAAGIPALAPPAAWPDALRLDTSLAPSALPGFAEGDVSVQDASAQAVAEVLLPLPPGARVLDACAAPGGKAAHLLERAPGLHLIALDVDARRLRRVHDTLARLGLAGDAVLQAADAAEPAAWWDGVPFAAILLDAPCSATGVVRRQPDILLHRRPADLEALLDAQARLLAALWPLLAPGGVLVYATCSILKDENEGQIERFLKRCPDARVQGLAEAFGHDRNVGRQRLPGEQGGDGFFCARLHRTSC